MVRRQSNALKRQMGRKIFGSGTSGIFPVTETISALVDLGMSLTIVRIIIDLWIIVEADGGATGSVFFELWRMSNDTGATLPTQDFSGDIAYGDNADLIACFAWGGAILDIGTSTNQIAKMGDALFKDIKGMRKLSRGEKLVLRHKSTSGANGWVGTITTFFKEA